MNPIATSHFRPRRLPIQWRNAPAYCPLWVHGGAQAPSPSRVVLEMPPRTKRSRPRAVPAFNRCRGGRAFTLLELMMVITIIGFLAALTLPHVRGFGQANSMTAATRQLMDDAALARQRAMVNRSTVYMVFLPPQFWEIPQYYQYTPHTRQETNLLMHQCAAYALISIGSVGDQPGRHFAHYVTDWRFLPDGVFIAPFEFTLTNTSSSYMNVYTTNTLSGTFNMSTLYQWTTVNVPFPSAYQSNSVPLPCIGFSPQGGLTTQFANQYIALARGSIFYATDTNGAPVFDAPNVLETPAGNDTNNASIVQLDWMTGRPTLMQNQLQ